MIRPTFVEIDLYKIGQNVKNIKSKLDSNVQFMAIVKADAYGHGIIEVSRTVIENGADWLGVALPEEGAALRKAEISKPILVLGGISASSVEQVVEYGLHQTVFNIDTIHALEQEGKRQNKKVNVHIKIDTGMNRIGVVEEDNLIQILDFLSKCSYVRLEGMFTHFAESDAEDKSFTMEQNRRFAQAVKTVRAKGFKPALLHAANSAAIIDCPTTHYNMVRAGIAMYGYFPSDEVNHDLELYPALTWKTHIIHIKVISTGETVSYGRIYTADKPTVVATLPVGYADGYRRILGNRAYVLVKGHRVPVIGRVCMDQCMIDVTGIPDIALEEEVVLLGEQCGERIGADEIASWCDTISYEVLTSISKRVPRKYVGKTWEEDASV